MNEELFLQELKRGLDNLSTLITTRVVSLAATKKSFESTTENNHAVPIAVAPLSPPAVELPVENNTIVTSINAEKNIVNDNYKTPTSPATIEERTTTLFAKIKNWLYVGEEFRRPEVSAEYAVATTWLVRGGIMVLLFGIGFFVKYSIDHGWLSPALRIIASLLLGVAMVGGGLLLLHKIPRYRALALGILGGGFATLYLATYGGYRLYQLIAVMPTFGFLILITAASMIVALRINALLPAMIGCISGYATPILLSTNSGNLPALLAYMTILAAGILLVARQRSWQLLVGTAFLLSVLLSSVAMSNLLKTENYLFALAFIAVNFLIFAMIPQIHRGALTIFEIVLTIANLAFYAAQAIPIAEKYAADFYGGAMTALFMAVVSLAQTRWRRADQSLMITWLCGAVFALATCLPLFFGAKWTITAWAALAIALLMMYVRLRIKALAILAVITFVAGFCVLCGQGLSGLPRHREYLSNVWERFWWCGVYVFALAIGGEILRRAREFLPLAKRFCRWLFMAAGIGFFLYSSDEAIYFLNQFFVNFRSGGLSLWWALLAFTAIYGGLRGEQKSLRIVGLILCAVCVGKVFLIDLAHSGAGAKIVAFTLLGVILLIGATAYIRLFKEKK